MSDFSVKLVQGIRTQNQELMEYLTQSNEKIQLNQIANILHMKIIEPHAKQILEKIFHEAENAEFLQRSGSRDVFLKRIVQILGVVAAIDLLVEKTESLLDS